MSDIDLDFVIAYREFLAQRRTTRNGKPNGPLSHLSPNFIRLVIEALGTMLNWATKPGIALLPADFRSPCTTEVAGVRSNKDPLRLSPFEMRAKLLGVADAWELCHLAFSMVLPLRPEEACGLLISDVNFEQERLLLGAKFGGRDFNKGRQEFTIPLPAELLDIARCCIGHRKAGPLLQDRRRFERGTETDSYPANDNELRRMLEDFAAGCEAKVICSADWKKLYRRFLRSLGGISPNMLTKTFRKVADRADTSDGIRLYDSRSSVTTELERSGVSHLVQRYVTGHTTNDILNEYVSLDPPSELRKYWDHISVLLDALRSRFKLLELSG